MSLAETLLQFRVLAVAIAVFCLKPTVSAQECLLPRLREAHELAERGTERWFATGLEVAESELLTDIRLALATATRLWEAADASSPPGAAPAAAAMAAFACARLEGPRAAETWASRHAEMPGDASALLRVYYHLATARLLCTQGSHALELSHSIPGQACADDLGVYALRLRAAMTTMQATPQRSVVNFRKLMQEGLRSTQAATVRCFCPWLALEELALLNGDDRAAETEQRLNEIEAAAVRDGNVRAQGIVASKRGALQRQRKDTAASLASFDHARAAFERLGDRYEMAACTDAMAVTQIERGNFDVALALIDRADEQVRGRGLTKVEEELLRTRFHLAVRQHDGDTAAALSTQLERRQDSLAADEAQLAEVRQSLTRAEEERAAAQLRLQVEHQASLHRAAELRLWAGAAVALLLAALAGLQWRSGRRLKAANRALAQQVQAVQRAKAEQVKTEARMHRLERAESLGTLAAGVAHDFNNLLTSILGNADLLLIEQGGGSGANLTAAIRAAGEQAARLCRQLQVYSGDAPIDRKPCDLITVTSEMLDVMRSATKGSLEVLLEAHGRSVCALIDRAQIEQVLLNLVINARDANARRVSIGIERTEHADGIAGPTAVLTVQDDGDGMSEEVRRRIFDPFFTTRFPGRGLGLAVVYGALRRHGGTVAVSGDLGRGTCFTIRLPLADAGAKVEVELPVVLPALPPRPSFTSTWIVDDEPAVRDLLVRMLRALGQEATATGDGDAFLHAVSRLPAELPVVAFVDLTMPGMDGPEVVRCLRELRDGTQVVLMTGHSLDQLEQSAAELKPAATLSKPFLTADVQRIVADLCVPRSARATACDPIAVS